MGAISKSLRFAAFAGIAMILLASNASAQQADKLDRSAQIPDYAAVLGTSQVVKDPATGVRRGLTQAEVQQRLKARGDKRSAQQRRESYSLNRTIHAMPATKAEAFRSAKKNSKGILVVRPSRDELQPMVGVIGPDGGLRASHDAADLPRDDN